MKKIREDFGPDAVILDSNPVRSKGLGGFFKQEVEVVAAYEPDVKDKPASYLSHSGSNPMSVAGRPAKKPEPERPFSALVPEKAFRNLVMKQPGSFPEEEKPFCLVTPEDSVYAAQERLMENELRTKKESRLTPQQPPRHAAAEPAHYTSHDRQKNYTAQENTRRDSFDEKTVKYMMPEPTRYPMPEPDRREASDRQLGRVSREDRLNEEASGKPAFIQYDTSSDPLEDQTESQKNAVQGFSQRVSLAAKDTALMMPPDILNLYNDLIEHDVPEELARQLALQTQAVQGKRQVKADTAAHQLIMDRLGETVPIRLKPSRQNVMFFVGPTGAGKTTTLVKLAGMLAFEQKLRVGLINMDTYRVGAMEHMRIYADIMSLPLYTAYSAEELGQAIEAMADRDIILVDTAGKSTSDTGYQTEMESYFQAAHADEVFLVMSIGTGHKACREIIQKYSFLPEYKIIVTKLDEVSAWGNILNIKDLAKKPLAYVTIGQNVPDDIRPVDTKKLADNIMGRRVGVL